MTEIRYKVLRNGQIAGYLGKRQLSNLLLNEPVPFAQRKALRLQLDRDLFRATLANFGTDWVPADYNEMCASKKLIKQLAADKLVRLTPLVLPFIQQGYLKASPNGTALKRLKSVLMRENYNPIRKSAGGWFVHDPKRPKTDVNRFWESYGDKPTLSEASWRFLCRQSCSLLRVLTVRPWQLRDGMDLFNTFVAVGLQSLTAVEYEAVDNLSRRLWRDRESFYQVLLAWKNAPYRGTTDAYEAASFYRQTDVIADWLYDAKPAVSPGATWQSLLTRALDWAASQAELKNADVESLEWLAVIEPFVANDGLVVSPITNGVDLLKEGVEMENCLAYQRSYAEDCVKGLSQVFRIQGVAGRATIEFERRQGRPWKLSQAQEKGTKAVSSPKLQRAIEQLKNRMEVSA
jgi:hypothetical protein